MRFRKILEKYVLLFLVRSFIVSFLVRIQKFVLDLDLPLHRDVATRNKKQASDNFICSSIFNAAINA